MKSSSLRVWYNPASLDNAGDAVANIQSKARLTHLMCERRHRMGRRTIKNELPLVSVAMTTYNGEKYLKEQIDSILNQSYKNIELVVCDDCSTDSTYTILQEYGAKDARIRIVRNPSNLGLVKNFEQAISLCAGEFIALSDQDDIWENWKIEKSLDAIGEHDIVCSNSLLVDSDNVSLGHTLKETLECCSVPDDQQLLFKHLCFHNFVQGATILAKATFLKSVASVPDFFLKIGLHDYWYALNASVGNGIVYLDVCTLRYRQHGRQVTTNTVKPNFGQQLVTNLPADEVSNHLNWCNNRVVLQDCLLSLPLTAEQKTFVLQTKKYFECMKDKNWYTFCYFVKYHDAIYLDKNIARKTLRIAKRFLGLIKHKLKRPQFK